MNPTDEQVKLTIAIHQKMLGLGKWDEFTLEAAKLLTAHDAKVEERVRRETLEIVRTKYRNAETCDEFEQWIEGVIGACCVLCEADQPLTEDGHQPSGVLAEDGWRAISRIAGANQQ